MHILKSLAAALAIASFAAPAVAGDQQSGETKSPAPARESSQPAPAPAAEDKTPADSASQTQSAETQGAAAGVGADGEAREAKQPSSS